MLHSGNDIFPNFKCNCPQQQCSKIVEIAASHGEKISVFYAKPGSTIIQTNKIIFYLYNAYFRTFLATISIQIEKSIDGVLGI